MIIRGSLFEFGTPSCLWNG